ncbi:MAG: hypothetical protein C4345_06545, partial [Chloroflexota bacterium]
NTRITDLAARLLYLPAWLAAFSYGGKTYRLVINGQTGKVTGEAPVAKGRVALAAAVAIVAVAIVVMLVSVVR